MTGIGRLLVATAVSLVPLAAVAESLCASSEATYFSCKIHESEKVLAVCGALGAKQYLQYRFGTPQHVELIYPKSKTDSMGKFLLMRDYRKTAGTTTYELSFRIASYSYAVFATEHPLTEEPNTTFGKFGGVTISSKPGKETELKCTGALVDNLSKLEGHVENR